MAVNGAFEGVPATGYIVALCHATTKCPDPYLVWETGRVSVKHPNGTKMSLHWHYYKPPTGSTPESLAEWTYLTDARVYADYKEAENVVVSILLTHPEWLGDVRLMRDYNGMIANAKKAVEASVDKRTSSVGILMAESLLSVLNDLKW